MQVNRDKGEVRGKSNKKKEEQTRRHENEVLECKLWHPVVYESSHVLPPTIFVEHNKKKAGHGLIEP